MRRVPDGKATTEFIREWVKWGAGLRASQALILAGEGAGADSRPLPCVGGRHPGAGAAGAAPPGDSEFLRRVGTHHRRQPGRTAARGGSRAAQRNVAMPSTSTSRDLRFLDPAVIARLGTMELKARTVVEGFLSGLHRSPYKGFSVEFADTGSTCRATTSPRSTGRYTREAIATTSRSSRKKPTSNVICCSTSARRCRIGAPRR